jgi:hypothetical protein
MSSNPYSYPFLRIARKYGVDYGDILHCAHKLEHSNAPFCCPQEKMAVYHLIDDERMKEKSFVDLYKEVKKAVDACTEIRNGRRDAFTGKPIAA